jgi:two-component system, chemotaxis family, chemotaxis protein CheY
MIRVLIVDDSRTARSILKAMLKEFNFEIAEAENGSLAMEELTKSGSADLALVDWNMPVMNGLEFVKAVRSDIAYENMKIMMVTTESEITRMMDALSSGANEYIMKPYTKDIVIEKLQILGILTNG